ncbi:glycoside hydrolase family 15 protein [Phosphitispora fastidiosa]|uniref:glycoside hydrolase family 15 protein n=1 Tax=Phosphitispora fastidiosa TaxID=2837202 RepID=UPI001E363270|nr:oligosaccharide amylase [Phosphitispora fastidiosa]
MKPLINTAIIGNGRILAALSSKGGLHRFFWPQIDNAQHLNHTWAALLTPAFGDRAVRLDDEGSWVYSQDYVNNIGVLQTTAGSKRGGLQVTTLDFACPDRDLVCRCFEIKNCSDRPLPVVFLFYASMHINESTQYNSTRFDNERDILFHYRQDTWFAIAGDRETDDYQCGIGSEYALSGNFDGNSVAMSPDGGQAWNLRALEPGETRNLAVFIAAGHNRQEAEDNIRYAREAGWHNLLQETTGFWEHYLGQAYIPAGAGPEVIKLYQRSVMVCRLLMNRDTGGIIAAPEFDECYTRCGGYAYVWGRDAAMIAHAMLKAGYPGYARDFYRWAVRNQLPTGEWPQRQYTSGSLAPGWGDQIDSTGAVIWGIYQYCKETWDNDFLGEAWPAVMRSGDFLQKWVSEESDLSRMSWDLWEERFGEHAYSCAAVYGGLKAAGLLAKTFGEFDTALRWLEAAKVFGENMAKYFWDSERERFIRSGWMAAGWEEFACKRDNGLQVREVIGHKGYISYEYFGDDTADASLLGLTVPFGVVLPEDDKMIKTAEHLEAALAVPDIGGIRRYAADCYIGGNPWVLTTLWLGMYYASRGNWEKAAGFARWALEHQTSLGFLPEQVDRNTGQTAWVVPLAWSHAMFLLLVNMFAEAGQTSHLAW